MSSAAIILWGTCGAHCLLAKLHKHVAADFACNNILYQHCLALPCLIGELQFTDLVELRTGLASENVSM